MKAFLYLTALCIAISIHTDAKEAAKKKSKPYLKLITAWSESSPGRIQGAPPATGDHFIVIWQGETYPEAFFWRGSGGWLTCRSSKVHRSAGKPGSTKAAAYTIEQASGGQAHKGDTLLLSPVTGGRFPIPEEIPASAKNTLFFKTNGSKWLSFPIKRIAKHTGIIIN